MNSEQTFRKSLKEAAQKNKAKVETENAVIDKVVKNPGSIFPDPAIVETQIDNSVRDFCQRLSYQRYEP